MNQEVIRGRHTSVICWETGVKALEKELNEYVNNYAGTKVGIYFNEFWEKQHR